MVAFNHVEIGDKTQNVFCCGEAPTITEYHENMHSVQIHHKCEKCGSTGSYGIVIPESVRAAAAKARSKKKK